MVILPRARQNTVVPDLREVTVDEVSQKISGQGSGLPRGMDYAF
jgi:hypothetical protein